MDSTPYSGHTRTLATKAPRIPIVNPVLVPEIWAVLPSFSDVVVLKLYLHNSYTPMRHCFPNGPHL